MLSWPEKTKADEIDATYAKVLRRGRLRKELEERLEKAEADNAALRERIAELEAELWNCKQSLTPPQRPEDATYYLETT